MKKLQLTYGYDDVTLVPNFSDLKSRSEANPSIHNFKLPVITSCMDTLGKDLMDEIIKNDIPFVANRAFKTVQEQYNHFIPNDEISTQLYTQLKNVWFAVGSVQKYKGWIDYLIMKGVRHFCVDMAHGDSQTCIDTIKYIKDRMQKERQSLKEKGESRLNQMPHIIAGNVATAEGFKRLQNAGANGIRIGVASGQCCSTALNTGFGVPILTNIMECAKVRKNNVWIIADGGVKNIGDIAKAVYFGADFCMIGKLFAATDKACGKCFNINKQQIMNTDVKFDQNQPCFLKPIYPHEYEEMYKLAEKYDWEKGDKQCKRKNTVKNNLVAYKGYHGMASREARNGLLIYASPEGAQGMIKYTRTTIELINDIFLNLQASLSYAGARNWEEFRKRTYPVMRSNAGIIAADTHLDVTFDK